MLVSNLLRNRQIKYVKIVDMSDAGRNVCEHYTQGDLKIYAVTGTLGEYGEYQLLLETACRFYDAVTNALTNHPK